MASSVQQQTLYELIEQRLEESDAANPEDIVDSLVDDILQDWSLLREALHTSLTMYVKQVQRDIRSQHWWEAHSEQQSEPHSGRWAKAAEAVSEQQSFFRDRVWVRNQWRFLGDLTREECKLVSEDYSNRAFLAQRNADRFKRLAELMETHNVQRVADLGETAREAFED